MFRLQENLTDCLPTIANPAQTDTQAKQVKPGQIELWHARMGHLGYKSLTTLKRLSTGMNFTDDIPTEICGPSKRGDQTRQPSRTPMSQSSELSLASLASLASSCVLTSLPLPLVSSSFHFFRRNNGGYLAPPAFSIFSPYISFDVVLTAGSQARKGGNRM